MDKKYLLLLCSIFTQNIFTSQCCDDSVRTLSDGATVTTVSNDDLCDEFDRLMIVQDISKAMALIDDSNFKPGLDKVMMKSIVMQHVAKENLNELLIEAAKTCTCSSVFRLLVRQGADVNYENDCEMRPIECAVKNLNQSACFSLKSLGAQFPDYLLHVACKDGNVKRVKLLLSLGVNPKTMNSERQTALSVAVEWGHDPLILQILLDNGADLNDCYPTGAKTWYCDSLIHRAVRETALLQFLIQKGVNINALGENVETALHKAVHYNNLKSIQLLVDNNIQGINLASRKAPHYTPLLEAAMDCSAEIVKILLDHGANVNVTDSFKRRPLHLAIFSVKDRLEKIKMLYQADPTQRQAMDCNGKTPLDYAWADTYYSNKLEVIDFLENKTKEKQ